MSTNLDFFVLVDSIFRGRRYFYPNLQKSHKKIESTTQIASVLVSRPMIILRYKFETTHISCVMHFIWFQASAQIIYP